MVNSLFPLFIFLFGLAIGSFLNCLIYRLETGQKFFLGRSFCPHCKHILSWQDLIPILSFLILKGKCRYCGQKISWQYPLVELSTAILFLLIFIFFFSQIFSLNIAMAILSTSFYFLITCFLIIIFVYDLKHYLIPDKVIYPAIAITILYQLFGPPPKFWWGVGLGILPSLFFLAIILFSQGRWLGMGDFKLSILMGLILGFPKILVALFFAFFIGAIIGIGLVLAKKKTLKSEIPFAPFLVTGTFVAIFWGQNIINCYFHWIGI